MLATRWRRLTGSSRVAGVDLARGLAVIGMLAAHLLTVPDFSWTSPDTWIAVVDGRSSILFATLAGVSIGLITGAQTPIRGEKLTSARLRLVVRAILLCLIGWVLIFTGVPVYVILPAYGILFVLALPFLALSARTLFVIAGVAALVMPFVHDMLAQLPFWSTMTGFDVSLAIGWHYPAEVWIAFVLAGLGVARAGIRNRRTQLALVGAGTALAVVGYGLDGMLSAPAPWTAAPHSSGVLEVVGSGGFALAVLGLCLLVCRTPVAWLVLPIRAVGAMPLTAYAAQLVIWAIVAADVLGDTGDLWGFRALEPFWPMTLGLLVGCTAWALLIGRGPLEWATASLARLVVRR